MTSFEGVGPLVRLALRRDRVRIPAWVAGLSSVAAATAKASASLYPTVASRVEAADSINDTASLVALFGRIHDPRSLDAVAMVKLTSFGAVMVAVLAVNITVRHSRAEEEVGRLELLGSVAVGRLAPLAAALAVALLTSIALGVATALGLMAAGLPSGGAIAFGTTWAAVGAAFAAASALAAQLARSARSATGLAVGFLAFTYVLRAVGDSSDRAGFLTWLSPLGWAHGVYAFAGDRWWPVALLIAFASFAVAGAFALANHRDLGAGILADRAGPPTAGPRLSGVLGLAWRLERGSLIGWTVAFGLTGLLVGSLAGNVGSILNSPGSRAVIRRLGGEQGLSDAFLAAELNVLGLVAAAYGVHAALRLRSEELASRAEPVLSAGVSRLRWAGGFLVVAISGTTCLTLTAGLTAGTARAVQSGHVADLFSVTGGAIVQLPAVWVLVGVVAAAFGIDTRFAVAGWAALGAVVLLGEMGALFNLPPWIIELSPFAHVPRLPGAGVSATPLAVLLLTAAALTIFGLAMFRRRDVT